MRVQPGHAGRTQILCSRFMLSMLPHTASCTCGDVFANASALVAALSRAVSLCCSRGESASLNFGQHPFVFALEVGSPVHVWPLRAV